MLLGHDSPTGEYPSPVVPVVEREGALCVCWRGAAGVALEEVQPDSEFVRHAMDDFDVNRDALFAFDADDVVSYPMADEVLFFDAVLQDSRMTGADPFFRLALAIETKHEDLIFAELLKARRRMTESAPDYAGRWYRDTLTRLGEEWTARAEELAAHATEVLPASPRAVLAGVALAERVFDREVTRLRDVLARSSGNGKVEELEDLRGMVAADVSISLAGSRVRPLVSHLRVPGTHIGSRFDAQSTVEGDACELYDEWSGPYGVAGHRFLLGRVPMLPADASWLSRVSSGVAGLEQEIARAIRDRLRLPRLRHGIDRASFIGESHRAVLHDEERAAETRRAETYARIDRLREADRAWVAETRRFGERCKAVVREEVMRWELPPLSLLSGVEAGIAELEQRCHARVETEVGKYYASLASRYVPDVADELLHAFSRYDALAGAVAWTRIVIGAAIGFMPLAVIFSWDQWRDGIRKRLLHGAGDTPGYFKGIDDWVEVMIERFQRDMPRREHELHTQLRAVDERSRDTRELLAETGASLRRLERLNAELSGGSLYIPR